jgi:hypothetical protein
VPLANTGTLEVQRGWISYNSGSVFGTGTQFTGAGTNLLDRGSVTFEGEIVSTNAELAGANLLGTNTVIGMLRWESGSIGSSARTTIAAGSELEIAGPDTKFVRGTLVNEGRVRLTGFAALGICAGRVENAGVFDFGNDQPVYQGAYCGASSFANTGLIRKSGGSGTNQFTGVPLANSGTVEAQQGWIGFSSGSVFETGTQFLGAGTNLLNDGTVWFIGTIVSANAELAGANLYGTNTVEGALRWNAGNIDSSARVTIASAGQWEIAGEPQKLLGGWLRNEGRLRLGGAGALGMCGGILENLGIVDLENDQPVYLHNYCPAAWVINTGWLRKTGGNGTNQFAGVPLVNTGTVEVRQGWVSYNSSSYFGSGTVFTGAGTSLLDRGNVTFEGSIVSTNAELAGANLLGTNTVIGVLRWKSGSIGSSARTTIAAGSELEITGPDSKFVRGTLVNEGRVRLTGSAALGMCAGRVENAGVFDFGNDQPVYQGAYCGTSSFANTGLIRKSGGTGTNQFTGVPLANSGTVEAQQGWIGFSSGSVFETGTQFLGAGTNLLNDGAVWFIGTVISSNAELAGANLFGTNTVQGQLRWTGGNIDNSARVTIAPGSQLEISGASQKILGGWLRNEGLVRLSGAGALGMCGGTFDNQGTFDLENDQPVYLNSYCGPSSFINTGLVRKLAGAATNLFSSVPMANFGTVESRSGVIAFDGGFTQAAGCTRLAGGNLSSSRTFEFNGGVLCGSGEIYANVIGRGEVNPGQSIGVITVQGNYLHTGTLNIELGGSGPGASCDRLAITGSATLRGTLNVTLAPGYRPQEGDVFKALTFASRTDSIRRFGGLDLGGGKYLTPVYGPTGLTLQTTSGPTNLHHIVLAPGQEGLYQIHYTCLPDRKYAIDASLQLLNDWVALSTNSSPVGVIDYLDVDAVAYPRRFYRAREVE